MHVAVAEGQKYPYEAILRSILKHLMDAATNEFLFIVDFFKQPPLTVFNKYVVIVSAAVFGAFIYFAVRIFGKTIAHIVEVLETHLLSCFDVVGLLLMIKVTRILL